MKKRKLLKFIPLVIVLLLVSYSAFWVSSYSRPTEEAVAVFNSNSGSNINVAKDKFITFTPKYKEATTGFIFYPGGKVAPEAYAPLCSKIAANGFMVVIVPMPLNLAVLSGNKGNEVIKDYPEIKNWVIGGHSLGGVMAASFAHSHLDLVKGLVMYAAYPQNKDDLSSSNLKVLSLWGSEDGCADINKVTGAKDILPKDSEFKAIDGGNHAQFGNYGNQKGDNAAKISVLEQQNLAIEYTVDLLGEVSK
ncbi:alpha/beta hydrolase [Clostridium sp. CS001]|uniref:alpha/beta hydrolase n=1 Tax=Clostridium sp. CS001 TaxID=2880648 RepID=UPI001CF157C4|nr:alpha/beta hydrolase [Clostridium sp. CS001]MCB2288590.1 alpha/beta hydrolase [Clostridium sp. CS001]